MNKEFPKEMKITPGGEEACVRMRLLLKRALSTITDALRDDANACMNGENPYRFLSAAVCKLRLMMRPRVGSVAFLTEIADYYCANEPRLRLTPENAKPDEASQAGQKKPEVFHTPKEIADFIMANPPLNIPPTAEPIDLNASKLRQGEGHVWYVEPNSIGNFYSGNVVHSWVFSDGAGIHVFAKQVFADGKYADCWNVTGTIDCEKVFFGTVIGERGRMATLAKFIRNGLLAVRMRRKHKAANRRARRDANAGEKEGC